MAAAFVSCSKKEERSATELSPFDITLQYADIPAESETKQSVSNLKYETHWDDSDAVALYNATTGVSHDDLFNEPIGEVRFKCKGVAGKDYLSHFA